MKNLIRNAQTVAVLVAALALPRLASAAVKTWVSLTPAPATTNIVPGVATNLTTTLTFRNGSGASARFAGPAFLSVSVSPAEASVTTSLSQTNFTFPNSDTTFNPTLTVTTTALTPSNTYVVTIIGNTNPPTPVNPNVLPITNFFTVTMATAAPFNPVKTWSPGGGDTNWSTAGNWMPSGAPGSSNDVKFFEAGAAGSAGTIDNVVDSSTTVGSLMYGQTNGSSYHTTLIAAGMTLSVTGTNGLAAGTGTDAGDGVQTVNTVAGAGGALVVNNTSANVNIGQAHPVNAPAIAQCRVTLDLSGLDTFTASVSRLLAGVDLTVKGSGGVLYLARTNMVTTAGAAPQVDVGANVQSAASGCIPSFLVLGQTNVFFAGSIAVGRGKTDITGGPSMVFNSSFVNPVAYFRGTSGGASRVGMWSIGDGWGSRTSQNYATNDFTGGTVDALVDQMFVGKGASTALGGGANVIGNGTLTFSAGTFDVNTLEVGYTIDAAGNGTVDANGGLLVVNTNLELAHGAGSVGTLNISGGTVSAYAGLTAGGGTATVTLNSGTLNVTNPTATIGSAGSPLATLAVTNSSLTLAVQNSTPSASVGTLAADGAANTINISSLPVITALPAQFQVIRYATPDGNLATFNLGTVPPASPAYAGYISNNTANASIDVVITSGPVTPWLVWDGVTSGNWDTDTANWKTNGVLTTYQQGYPVVRLDDTLSAHNTVTLTTTLTPGTLTVDNSMSNYTFVGSGKLSGSTGLTKSGTGLLMLAESGTNDFTGGVTVNGGTLQVGNGTTAGTLPPGNVSVAAGATLVFDHSDNVSVASVISGVGTVTQNGLGIVSLNGSNSAFGGEIIVAQGTLKAGNAAALGTVGGGVTVSNAATLDVNGQVFNNAELVTVAGAGVVGNGAIINSGANATKSLRNVTLTDNTTFGGSGDWDIHSTANGTSDASLSTSGTGFKLTKAGTNTVTIFGAQVDGSLGDIDVVAGSLSFERNTTSMGDSTKTATVFTNAALQLANASNVWNKIVVLKDGATLRAVNRDEFAGPVTLESGVGTVFAGTGAQLILDAVVSGAGGLTKNGSGSLSLASASTYAGPTLVGGGSLLLINSGSIDSSTNITAAAGATLDLSGLSDPTLTITSGRSLKGSGTVVGNVTMANAATLVPGDPGTNTIDTLTVASNLVLQAGSTTLMELNKTAGLTNDQVVANSITYGGTLTVTGLGGAYVAGDSFKLFAGSYGGSFTTFNLPANVTWNTTQLGVDGTLRVTAVAPPQISSFARGGAGSFSLAFSGPAGNSYRVWASTNVGATPITSTWTLLTNGLFGVSGNAVFVDASASAFPVRFYAVSVP